MCTRQVYTFYDKKYNDIFTYYNIIAHNPTRRVDRLNFERRCRWDVEYDNSNCYHIINIHKRLRGVKQW